MSIFAQFTEAQTRAWDYARAAVDAGIKATAALNAYKDEGGSIRRQDWFRIYNSIAGYADTWKSLETFTNTETVPNRFWMEAPRKFAQQFVAEVELAIRNVDTGELQRTFRYIESDYRMSQSEIKSQIDDMGSDYPTGESWQAEYIYGYKFYQKGK